jgi:dephospho-CoA kinase
MLVVGLTGGIGSGKSAVAAAFAARGVEVADADAIVHELSVPGNAGHRAIVQTFGSWVLAGDGSLDRAALRKRAFADPAFRERLEAVLHPLVGAEIGRRIDAWQGRYGIVVVPLLLERGGVRSRVGRVLVVDCPEEEQIRRVGLRSGLSRDEVRAIMATQLPRAERLAQADDVIDNGGPPGALAAQVESLDRRYRIVAADVGNA